MRKLYLAFLGCAFISLNTVAQTFTPGNLVVLQTAGTTNKASSQATLKEFTTTGTPGITVAIPTTGATPFQTAGIYGGSEGFLSTSSDNKFLVVGGYRTSGTFSDITGTTASSVPRALGIIYPSGYYLEVDTSTTFYSANDIRGGISDGTNFWASGASNATDGINYFGPGAKLPLGVGAKAYGLRIFNGQIYYSTQKAGPNNTASQMGILTLGTGLQTTGPAATSLVINTGATNTPEDFSINPAGDVCYIAINLNTVNGGIQKWTKVANVWTLAYTLGTGVTNMGAYGLVVDYSGANPVIYATTFDGGGNRVIKITDIGSTSTATTIVPVTAGVYYKGISFAPVATGTPVVNLAVSKDTASEAGVSVVTVSANTSAPVAGAQTVSVAVSGTGITSGDFNLSGTTITIPAGSTTGSVTFTVVNDILGEGAETALVTMSSPSTGIVSGLKTTQRIYIADNDGNNFPTITMNLDSTTNYIDAGLTVAPVSPFKLSGVISDPTDAASTQGLYFVTKDLEMDASALVVTVKSSNQTVVPLANITLTGADTMRRVQITPAAVGFSDITVTVKDNLDSTSYVINYAASAASATPANTIWPTGISDASDAIALDDNYYVSGDDELNVLNVYSRTTSGMPVTSYTYTSSLNLPEPASPEVDIEAATPSLMNPGKVFWMGSMSNGKAPFNAKPNRDRLFATNISGTGSVTSFAFNGYSAIKASLLTWGDANGYSFTASAAAGVDSKSPSGFAAEGMVFGPDSTTLYIGLRAPLVPVNIRDKAVIAPISNFETWFNNGSPIGNPTYGAPIELDLGGRGIRDIIRLSNGTYIIVAGNSNGTVSGALYKWTGVAGDAPRLVNSPATDNLNMEGAMAVSNGNSSSFNSIQVLSDMGDEVMYNDGNSVKDFNDLIYRKFRLDNISSIDLEMPPVFTQVQDDTSANTALNSCDTVMDYNVIASGVSMPEYTYSFSGATTGTGIGKGNNALFNRGTTQVTITATNEFGSADTTFDITVIDTQLPTITAPADMTVYSTAGSCDISGINLGQPVTIDNCTVQATNDAPQVFSVGVTNVIWTVTDAEGNTAVDTQEVRVNASGENWTGTVNSLWSNPANWSCGVVPTANTDVVILSTATHMPLIDIPGAICDSLQINNGTQLAFLGVGNVLELKGTIMNNGQFNASSGEVVLSGVVPQHIPAGIYGSLKIDGGSDKILDGNITVVDTLTFEDGHLVIGTNHITLADPQAQIGGSDASYIVTNNTGLVIAQNMGDDSTMFHIGCNAASYNPIVLQNVGVADTFRVRVMEHVYVNGYGQNPAMVSNPVVARTWMVNEQTTGGSFMNMTPYWSAAEEINGFDQNHVYVAHYTGGQWIGYTDSASDAPAAVPVGSMFTTYADSIQNFSPFTVASIGAFPLDFNMGTITASNEGSSNRVVWNTISESAGDVFEIERSANAKKFSAIASMNGTGPANTYTYIDEDPNVGINYYRVKIVSTNGRYTYSNVVSATMSANDIFSVNALPNPVTEKVTIRVNGRIAGTGYVDVTDIMGRSIRKVTMDGNAIEIDMKDVAEGIYFINYNDNLRRQSIKVTRK